LDDYIVSANGALVKHAETEEVLYECPLPDDDAATVISEGLKRDATVFCFGRQGVYVQRADGLTYSYQQENNAVGLHVVDLTRELPERGLLKVTWAADPEQVAAWAEDVGDLCDRRVGSCLTSPYYLEFTSPGADKAAGVGAVAQRYGIAADQVIAFGDGNNDVPMLAWAGLGIAMPNGRPAARAAAKRTAPPGDAENALARAVTDLLGGSGAGFGPEAEVA